MKCGLSVEGYKSAIKFELLGPLKS